MRITGFPPLPHNGFSYTFGYDGYGNNTSVAVGGRTLTTNTFNLQAGLPAGSTYGNGDTVTYSYDNKERLVGKSFNGTPAVSYKYDAMGSLVETEDLLNNISFKTQYDLINRIIRGYVLRRRGIPDLLRRSEPDRRHTGKDRWSHPEKRIPIQQDQLCVCGQAQRFSGSHLWPGIVSRGRFHGLWP